MPASRACFEAVSETSGRSCGERRCRDVLPGGGVVCCGSSRPPYTYELALLLFPLNLPSCCSVFLLSRCSCEAAVLSAGFHLYTFAPARLTPMCVPLVLLTSEELQTLSG